MAGVPDIVMGAGIAGLSAGYLLTRGGREVRLFEAEPFLGGAGRTERFGDFRFDLGGHRFYTRNEQVKALVREVVGGDLLTVERISRIHLNGRFVHYPLTFFNALSALSPATSALVGASYVRSRLAGALRRRPVVTFEDWIVRRFGRKLYEIYFRPYSEKVWGVPCAQLGADFAEQRIKGLSFREAVRAMFRRKRGSEPATLVSQFLYPRFGFGQIPDGLAAGIHPDALRLASRVVGCRHDGVRLQEVIIKSPTGREAHRCGEVVMTIPITDFVRLLEPAAPAEVLAAAAALSYRDIIICFVALDREQVTADHWIYFPSPKTLFGRIHEPKNWSRDMAPARATGLVAEIFCFKSEPVWSQPDGEILQRVVTQLEEVGLIAAHEFAGGSVVRLEKAYPLYRMGYQEHLETIKGYLARFKNLHCAGRNGLFRYSSGDRHIEMGMKAAWNILGEKHDVEAVGTEQVYAEK